MTNPSGSAHLLPTSFARPRRSLAVKVLAVSATAAAMIGSSYAPAFADVTAPQGVQGIVEVGSAIALTGLPASFTLSGDPGDAASDVVEYNVATNDVSGYTVTVTPTTTNFVSADAGVTDTFSVSNLVADDATVLPTPVAETGATLVHTQAGRSVDVDGDDLTTEYSMEIPFVQSGTYTATLNYVAATTL